MGRKVGITQADVVAAAAEIADRDGLDAASLSAVADRLGIRTPSLYNHVSGIAGLRRQLALMATRELTAAFETAAAAAGRGSEQLRSIAWAYRHFAREHPGLYAALLPAPRPGDDDELYAAMAAPVHVVAEAMQGAGVGSAETIHLIRALRAMLHGFVDLESKRGFGKPVDIDASFEEAVEVVVSSITRRKR